MKRIALGVLAFASLTSAGAYAVSCGTMAAPTSCSVTVGGTTTYTFTAFTFLNAAALGGGNLYTGADINIDVAAGGGLTALLTFSKSNANPGVVFLANPGETSSFTFSYNVTIAPAVPGTVAYGTPFTVGANGTQLGTGGGTVQLIISQPGVSCQAILPSPTQANCAIPAGQPLTLTGGDIINLAGNTGNVSITSFTNLFNATFAPAVPPTLGKAFNPATINGGGVSTLTVTLTNPDAAVATLTSPLVDTLPSGVVIAPTPNASTTCGGIGAPVAVAGDSTVTLPAGRSIPANGSCTLTVDVTSGVGGSHVNTLNAGALVTSNGNNAAPAVATLLAFVAATPIPTLSEWAMILLAALLAVAGFATMRRRRR